MKKFYRKCIAILGLPLVLLIQPFFVLAANPADDVIGTKYETSIRYLYDRGIVQGYSDGTFMPNNGVNRAEFLALAIAGTGKGIPVGTYQNCFKDVRDQWFSQYVCYAKSKGWVKGYPDGTFKPANKINLVESLAIFVKINALPDNQFSTLPYGDVQANAWYIPALRAAHARNLIEEYSGSVYPASLINRGRASDILYRYMSAPQSNVPKNNIEVVSTPSVSTSTHERLRADDFQYVGAFRLPKEKNGDSGFGYGGGALAFNPNGDSNGAVDGYPGSLYITGHEGEELVAEVAIPIPQKPQTVSIHNLNTASFLHSFVDITQGLKNRFEVGNGVRLDGLAYLAAQGSQATSKLYWTARTYYNVDTSNDLSHGMSDANLDAPAAQGMWRLGDFHGQMTGGYIFPVPQYFADAYLHGMRLISGLFTQQGVSATSQGPAFFAYGPWLDTRDNTPLGDGTKLSATALTYYPYQPVFKANGIDTVGNFPDFQIPDSWDAAAWVNTPTKHAIVVVGRRSSGETFYGDARPTDCTIDKGYHGDPYSPSILLYDPQDLALVTQGTKDPTTVVPYAEWNPSQYLMPTSCEWLMTGAAFDEKNHLLYVMERNADNVDGEPTPLIYVFKIN